MTLVRGCHRYVWASVAVLLFSTSAILDAEVAASLRNKQSSNTDPAAASVSTHAKADRDLAKAPADSREIPAEPSDGSPAVADATVKFALASANSKIEGELILPNSKLPPELPDACLLTEACVDEYLWQLYERARKIDTVKVREQIKVTVKKKGKNRTVTKTITKLVDEDFTWKDPDAAQKVGMPVPEYV